MRLSWLGVPVVAVLWSCSGVKPPEPRVSGPERAVVGEWVQLDGTKSGDGNEPSRPLALLWSFTAVPAGSQAAFNDPSLAKPSFLPDVAGEYVARLMLDNGAKSASADLMIVADDCGPRVGSLAVAPQAPRVGDAVSVSVSPSTSCPDTDLPAKALRFSWTLAASPAGSSVALSGAKTEAVGLMPDLAGDYTLRVTVSDGVGRQGTGEATLTAAGDAFVLRDTTAIYLEPAAPGAGPYADEDLWFNGEYLSNELSARLGRAMPWVYAAPPAGARDVIVLHRPDRAAPPDPYDVKAQPGAGELPFEGFKVEVSPLRIDVRSGDPRGQRYAAQWLAERLDVTMKSWSVASVSDAPMLGLRAVNLGNFNATEVLTYLDGIAGARFNVVQWHFSTKKTSAVALDALGMAVPASAVGKDTVRNILAQAARRHIVVVPVIPFLTHQETFLGRPEAKVALKAAYPATNGVPILIPPAEGVYDPTYVTSDGRSIYDALVFPIVDEVADLFSTVRPLKTVHIGHDEATPGALASVAQRVGNGITAARLFADDIINLHGHLATRGLRTVVWGDMLVDPKAPDLAAARVRDPLGDRDGISAALDMLATAKLGNLIVEDWRYGDEGLGTDYPTNDYFKGRGFEVFGATWHGDFDITAFTRDEVALGGRGMIATLWYPPASFLGRETEHGIAFSGDCYWTGGSPTLAPNALPRDSSVILTDASGQPKTAFLPGETIQAWVDALDRESPRDKLTNWVLRIGWNSQQVVATHVPAGLAFAPSHSWKLEWTLPPAPTVARGNAYDVVIDYTDEDGLPNETWHYGALLIGALAGSNLLGNSSFEGPFGAIDGNWTNWPAPTGTIAGVSASVARTGARSMCVEVKQPCPGCAFPYSHTVQQIDVSTLGGASLYVRGWLRFSGRDPLNPSMIQVASFDAVGQPACLAGKTGAGCHFVNAGGLVMLADGAWYPVGAVVTPGSTTTKIRVVLTQGNFTEDPAGQTCWDDLEVFPLAP